MIGCFADALSEEITVDGQELDDARWFTKAEAADMLAGRAKASSRRRPSRSRIIS